MGLPAASGHSALVKLWVWPEITTSMAGSSRDTIRCRGPCQENPCGVRTGTTPWWMVTRMAWTPWAVSSRAAALIASASSVNSRSAVAQAGISDGVSRSTAPMMPTGTPWITTTA